MKLHLTYGLFLAIVASSNAQMSRETALSHGWAALEALNGGAAAPLANSTADLDTGPYRPPSVLSWTVCAGPDTASVNNLTGQVDFVSMGDAHDRLFKESRPSNQPHALRSMEDATAQARKWASALGWPVGEQAECKGAFPKLDSNGVGVRAGITVRFLGDRDGYRSPAEDVSFTMDSITGEVADASRPVGYTFESGKLNIDSARALAIAREAGSGVQRAPAQAEYLAMSAFGFPGESARGLHMGANKIAILGYAIEGDKKVVYIAGDTGEVLLSFSARRLT
jgi:hypothetical protein